MTSYNCYAYALGRSSWCSPGELSGHGDMTQTTLKNKSIYELAEYVKDDLQSSTLNKKCVKITYTRPSYSSFPVIHGGTSLGVQLFLHTIICRPIHASGLVKDMTGQTLYWAI